MKELKFRAWSKKHNSYLKFKGIQYDDDKIVGVFVVYGTIAGIPNTICLDPEAVVVEQCTGLKDKNGKDIYEGDILGGIWECGAILYCDKCKQLQFHLRGNECTACSGDTSWADVVEDDGNIEVIGNIHENPDLLEER